MMQEYGKYCLDMSKLIFGGVILAGIMNLGVNNSLLFTIGGLLVAFFTTIGFFFTQNQSSMEFIWFLLATGAAGLVFFFSVMWYDRKHQYDW